MRTNTAYFTDVHGGLVSSACCDVVFYATEPVVMEFFHAAAIVAVQKPMMSRSLGHGACGVQTVVWVLMDDIECGKCIQNAIHGDSVDRSTAPQDPLADIGRG